MATVEVPDTKKQTEGRTNVHGAFPLKLHFMLGEIEADGGEGIVSWAPHGRCFRVHKPDEFVNKFLGRWFNQSKYSSFQRQLNLYGFKRLTSGPDKNSCYHPLFLRGFPTMARSIQRMGLKGTGPRRPSSPETEPNFYNMAPLTDGTSPPGAVSPVTHHASVELLVHGDSGSLLALADPSSRLALLHNTHGSAQGLQSHLHLSNGALHVDALPRMSTMEQALRVLLQRQTAAMPLPTSSSALDSVSHYNRLQAQLVLAQAAERRRAAAAAAAAVHPNGHGLLRELLGLQEPPPQPAPSVTTSDGHDALIREILLRNLLSNARSRGAI